MKLMMKNYLFCIISLNFDPCFFELPRDIVYGVISGNCLNGKLLGNAKKSCKILKLILEQGFCPFNT